mmetsp:Transcript_27983/g.24733  ORF Transcript_27983/g.24733 Transcript_27983/m.24733 type:complete len:105 (+) Transcript_27983:544-858(+)
MGINAIFTISYNVSPTLESDNFDAPNWMYAKPWSRMGAYFTGAIFGLSYFELRSKDRFVELEDSTFNMFYKKLGQSRMTSFIFFILGISITAAYSFPIRDFYQN